MFELKRKTRKIVLDFIISEEDSKGRLVGRSFDIWEIQNLVFSIELIIVMNQIKWSIQLNSNWFRNFDYQSNKLKIRENKNSDIDSTSINTHIDMFHTWNSYEKSTIDIDIDIYRYDQDGW